MAHMYHKFFYAHTDKHYGSLHAPIDETKVVDSEMYSNQAIDLNEQLAKNQPDTFFMQVNSDAMAGAGIHQGDMVIVDRTLEPVNGKVVIAVIDGEMLIRKLEVSEGKRWLAPAGGKLAPLDISYGHCHIWGVVTYVIRRV
jgi:DNA polymerase V